MNARSLALKFEAILGHRGHLQNSWIILMRFANMSFRLSSDRIGCVNDPFPRVNNVVTQHADAANLMVQVVGHQANRGIAVFV